MSKARRGLCKSCWAAEHKKYRVANRQRVYAHKVAWNRRNPEKVRKIARRETLKRVYGLSEADFNNMLRAQGNRCAICGTPFGEGLKANVDHCHNTGNVRALLCVSCNTGLGVFRDSTARMAAAIDYINRFS